MTNQALQLLQSSQAAQIEHFVFMVRLFTGCFCGTFPLFYGAIKNRFRLGLIGFLACMGVVFLFGLIGGIITAGIFLCLVNKGDVKKW